jgi:hypothetical protein
VALLCCACACHRDATVVWLYCTCATAWHKDAVVSTVAALPSECVVVRDPIVVHAQRSTAPVVLLRRRLLPPLGTHGAYFVDGSYCRCTCTKVAACTTLLPCLCLSMVVCNVWCSSYWSFTVWSCARTTAHTKKLLFF